MNEKTTSVNWHAMDAEAVFERLDSGEDGLDEVKAKQRIESTGLNSLKAEEGVSPLRLLVRQVNKAAKGRVILAHLGNGASLAAVRDGKSVDTSMGFTPTSGLPMSTRPGDLDPGLLWYWMREENLTPKQFNNLINHESGLLGISETSSDMRDLIKRQTSDVRAVEAVELFCYYTRKWIGAFAAVLGGLDTLVFASGIGENSPEVHARICDGMGFLGIELEEKRNAANERVISAQTSRFTIRVIHTNEELMIAKMVCRVSGPTIEKEYGYENKKSV